MVTSTPFNSTFQALRMAEVYGNWPFADGLFDLFVKPQEDALISWTFQK